MSERQEASLDPAVRAILGEQAFQKKLRTSDQQTRGELKRQKARHRVTLELHPAVVAALRQIAAREGCSPAAACNYLLAHALLQYRDGEIDFAPAKRGTESNRWDFVIVLDEFVPELEGMVQMLLEGHPLPPG